MLPEITTRGGDVIVGRRSLTPGDAVELARKVEQYSKIDAIRIAAAAYDAQVFRERVAELAAKHSRELMLHDSTRDERLDA